MKQLSDYGVCLLIDEAKSVIFPFSLHGFEFTDRWTNTAKEDNRHCWFLFSDGSVQRITEVAFIDSAPLSRVRTLFGRPIRIKTTLEAVDVPISRMKALILEGIIKDQKNVGLPDEEPWKLLLLSFPKIRNSIESSATSAELFQKLELPPPTECLDLL